MDNVDIAVIGAGPAGVVAALRAAELGARTALITRDEFGGMAANDGPIPVRTLAQAARLLRGAHRLHKFGIEITRPRLDYARLLDRVREVVIDVRRSSGLLKRAEDLGIFLHQHSGTVRFTDAHTIETGAGLRLQADRFILCAGGTHRRLTVPGSELTASHSDAWTLQQVPASMLVIGGGMTGCQVASIFQAFGAQVTLFQAAARILTGEDEDVSAAVARAFRNSGMAVREAFGTIDSFEKTADGMRMNFSTKGEEESATADLIVVAIGWAADVAGLNLPLASVKTNERGYIAVDARLCTSAPHIYAAGDITGRWMLVPQAIQDGWIAATNAAGGHALTSDSAVCPTGGFTEPEYASVGPTEAQARAAYDAVTATVHFDETVRTIIDDRTEGFCKLIVERSSRRILGCHVVGERAVEIVQLASICMTSGQTLDDLLRVPLSFPTYTGVLLRAFHRALEQLPPSGQLECASNSRGCMHAL